jgi:serine phosphatase RsbU (regulator of sigma subunit)
VGSVETDLAPKPHPVTGLKVLAMGGDEPQFERVRAVLRSFGHDLVCGPGESTADAAADIPALYARHRPDLVILDLGHYGIAGYGLIEALRRMEDVRWVPIWCLGMHPAALSEGELAAAIGAGADAFFPRPLSAAMLTARLTHLDRYLVRQRQFLTRGAELQAYYHAAEEEIRAARGIMDQLLRPQPDGDGALQAWIAPAVKFSGDAVVAQRSPDGSLKILVADGVGHGLAAALNVLPVGRAFQSMAQKGFGLPALVTELNHVIRRDLPSHRFVAATLVNVDAAEGLIEVWNGGNPACMIADHLGSVIDVWPSQHLPLGIVDSAELDPRPDRRALRPDTQLLLYSDGAIEALDVRGIAFGEAALLRAFTGAVPAARFEAVKVALVDHLAGQPANDDVTLALLDCGAEMRRHAARLPAGGLLPVLDRVDWQMDLRIGAARLGSLDMVPILQEFLGRIDPQWARDEAAFTVLYEAYNQALEHGLLDLDPRIKEQPDGLTIYAAERELRLQDLVAGGVQDLHIAVACSAPQPGAGSASRLRIRIGEAAPGAGR